MYPRWELMDLRMSAVLSLKLFGESYTFEHNSLPVF